jgi:phosphatidate cytidylyltransferase
MPPRSAFASRSRYEILGEQDVDVESEESEVEQTSVVLAPPIQAKPNGTSKSAQKKEARQRKKASSGSEADASSILAESKLAPKPETVSATVDSAKDTLSNAVPDQVKDKLPSATAAKEDAEQVATAAVQKASDVAGKVQDTTAKQVASAAPAMETAVNKANETAGHIKAQPSKAFAEARAAKAEVASSADAATQSKAVPSVTPFNPSLPSSLPHPPADTIPSNRKRKPTDALPGSPNSKGVKFQDGLLPGEGKEGEKIIKGVDRHDRGSLEVKGGKGIVQQGETDKKSRNVVERTIWTFIMIGGFIGLLCMGHPYMILLVMLCQTLVYKEVTALFALRDHGGSDQAEASATGRTGDAWNKTLNWYFFVVTNYFLYGESIIYYFKVRDSPSPAAVLGRY